MALIPLTKLGTYEIVGLLGAGAMGEVYRARDTKLKRDVAIKTLPDALSRDPERLSRFQREAEVLASLNHPNIASIYSLEEVDDLRFLVLELVEGETLADNIARGPIAVDVALGIARQIAEAMEAAHTKGIVHRDLKPANVKITPGGKVKVLDFGLAKIYEPGREAANVSQTPTLVSGTMTGAILGTAAYMSPEQARGQTADDQSDIWAFGCILYEMLSGKPSFQGDTIADVFASIMKSEPDRTALPQGLPQPVVLLLRRCLQKDRGRRLRHIGDAALEIEQVLSDSELVAAKAAARTPSIRTAYVWLVAIIAVLAAIAIFAARNRPVPDAPIIRFAVPPPQRFFRRGQFAEFAVSPDGRYLAFIAEDTARRLWIRPLDSPQARPIPGTDNATSPFWSADSRYIAFLSSQKLQKVSVADGHIQVICGVTGFPQGTWNRDNVIVFSMDGILYRVSADGGDAEALMKPDATREERGLFAPQFLSDGDHLLFSVLSGQRDAAGLWWTSLKSSERKRLLPFPVRAISSPTGHLLYVRDDKLTLQPFDSSKLAITGEAVVLANESAPASAVADFDLSTNGVLAWTERPKGAAELVWHDRTGKRLNVALGSGLYRHIRLSPDATRAAVVVTNGSSSQDLDVWLLEMSSGVFSRLTPAPGRAARTDVVWSPDGRELAFASGGNLYRQIIGAANAVPALQSSDSKWLHDWSQDDRFLVFAHDKGVYAVPPSGEGVPLTLVESDFDKDEFRVSPDGRWIAYNSSDSGRSEIYVASFPNFAQRRQVSNAGGAIPRWRKDMHEMYYLRLDGALMAVDVMPGKDLQTGAPHMLFQTSVPVSSVLDQYDVTGDGNRFLIIDTEENATSPPINVVVNWTAQLPR